MDNFSSSMDKFNGIQRRLSGFYDDANRVINEDKGAMKLSPFLSEINQSLVY